MADVSKKIRRWIMSKGNPVMTSSKKRELEAVDPERYREELQKLQEEGADYNAKVHRKPPARKVD